MKAGARCIVWLLWAAGAFPLLYPPIVRGLKMSACGNDGLREIIAGEITHFTCEDEGRIYWYISLCPCIFCDLNLFEATCYRNNCNSRGVSRKTFKTGFIDTKFSYISIDAVNNTEIYDNEVYVNETVFCSNINGEMSQCGLNYIAPSQDVSCVADIVSWSVSVSCVIGRAYSSRRIYKCQLFRLNYETESKTLETVGMITSPTSEKITRTGVKVSGSCQFITTLPPDEGRYHFTVSVSPGGRNYSVKLPADIKWIVVERPRLPSVSCGPRPHLRENSACTCSTTSLGQPAGYLRWSVDDQTNLGRPNRVDVSQARRSLTLSWQTGFLLRCDVIWGAEVIHGESTVLGEDGIRWQRNRILSIKYKAGMGFPSVIGATDGTCINIQRGLDTLHQVPNLS